MQRLGNGDSPATVVGQEGSQALLLGGSKLQPFKPLLLPNVSEQHAETIINGDLQSCGHPKKLPACV